jgi:hypothetical protein
MVIASTGSSSRASHRAVGNRSEDAPRGIPPVQAHSETRVNFLVRRARVALPNPCDSEIANHASQRDRLCQALVGVCSRSSSWYRSIARGEVS